MQLNEIGSKPFVYPSTRIMAVMPYAELPYCRKKPYPLRKPYARINMTPATTVVQ
jgi:hypothetical protein